MKLAIDNGLKRVDNDSYMVDQRKYNLLVLILSVSLMFSLYHGLIAAAEYVNAEPLSPLPYDRVEFVEVPVYQKATTIEAKIAQAFGEHTDKAMLLLKGNGPDSCGENKSLDPTQVNDNTEWGGRGRDVGLFQINNSWQQMYNETLLKDPDVSIAIAWKLFKDNGHSFKLWTCGKAYGI